MNLKRWIKPFQNVKSPYLKLLGTRLGGNALTRYKVLFEEKKELPENPAQCTGL